MTSLASFAKSELQRPVPKAVSVIADHLLRALGGDAVLFYGSALRTADLDGVLDFYVLRDGNPGGRWPAMVWPHVSYHELEIAGRTLRAKVATMPMAIFESAASGRRIDTTIWTRFAQPARLVASRSPAVTRRVVGAICDCLRTACRFAAALGPAAGSPRDYWLALFRQTYRAELRIEKAGRADAIVDRNAGYYGDALRLAWRDMGIIGQASPGDRLMPRMDARQRMIWRARWRRRRIAGRPLNILRLIRAAWTFDGAARYALWKIERHSGIAMALTPWRERHPVLGAPGVLVELWRAGRK